jgi:hypothetical protein
MFESCRPLPPGLVWRSNELVGFRTAPRIEPFRRVASSQIPGPAIHCCSCQRARRHHSIGTLAAVGAKTRLGVRTTPINRMGTSWRVAGRESS